MVSLGQLHSAGYIQEHSATFREAGYDYVLIVLSFLWSLQENSRLLQARGVAYINADSSVEGKYCGPHKNRRLCSNLVHKSCPNESAAICTRFGSVLLPLTGAGPERWLRDFVF